MGGAMPISRTYVQLVCSKDEYEIYSASLRVALPELRPAQLQAYIRRARKLVGDAGLERRGRRVFRRVPLKAELLSGALSRFEGRLRILAGTPAAGGKRPGRKPAASK